MPTKNRKRLGEVVVRERNPLTASIHGIHQDKLKSCLSAPAYFYKEVKKTSRTGKTYKRKERFDYRKYYIDRNGYFPAGFIPRVVKYLESLGHTVVIDELKRIFDVLPMEELALEDITLRDYQRRILYKVREIYRGTIVVPTGGGKTIVAAAIVAMFYNERALIVVPTKTIFHQFIETFEKVLDMKVGKIGDGLHEIEPVTIGIIKSLKNVVEEKEKFAITWNLVIVDEVHKCRSLTGEYNKVVGEIPSEYKYGLTATLPSPIDDPQGSMIVEGLIGPNIIEIEREELVASKVLSIPRVKIKWVPEHEYCKDIRGGYPEIYRQGIVENNIRNKLIIDDCIKFIHRDISVLVLVEFIEHGNYLMKIAEEKSPDTFAFVHGEMKSETIRLEQNLLEKKERMGVIATRVWGMGTDIRSVGAIVNAAGGLKELSLIQKYGRGMRATDDKKEFYVIDYFDSNHKHFLKHSGKRLCTFFDLGWL